MPIRAVVVGVGGRGSGAGANFQEAVSNLGVDGKIIGIGDLFPENASKGGRLFNVPEERCFSGFGAYKKAINLPEVNYVILATPPGFRAPMFKACVEAGKNVFMEKPVAVDGPTARTMYAAADLSKEKNLKVAAGTQRRHQAGYIETIKRIHDGAIGDVVTLRVYWVNGGPIWHYGDPGEPLSHYGQQVGDTDLDKQLNNWYHYIWLCGDHICEQHVHNLDVGNWIMQDHPVRCWAMGGRQQLGNKSGEIWDGFGVEYEYPNGVHMFSYCGQIHRDWARVDEGVEGTEGTAIPSNFIRAHGGWTYRFREQQRNPYVQEHMDLIDAIQNDKDLNQARQVTDSTVTAIMGREAGYSGAAVEFDEVVNSTFQYGPEQLLSDCSAMEFGPFRTLVPPMPSEHNIFKDPPIIAVKG